ncbi:MFS transporter [Citricoccus sp. SGAir0253]|uniref:MFS transporter n=1 Tax=Citricoccus sp. SGAir0253 TaxID=2567881 RepID=UPI00143CC31B|nr:MFS transporter [Citricoccus sp. SGAir0253]
MSPLPGDDAAAPDDDHREGGPGGTDRPPRDRRLWSRDFVLAMVVQLGVALVFMTLMTYMALYAGERFGARDVAAGFAASAFILGSALARIVLGKYLDVIGRKRLLVSALLVYVACSALYPLAGAYGVLVALRVVQGAAFGAATTAVTAGVLQMVPPSRRGEGMGYFLTASTVANGVGPLLAVQLSTAHGPAPVFLLVLGASVLALGAAVVLRVPELAGGPPPHARRFRLRPGDVLDPDALPVALVILIVSFGYAGIATYSTPFLLQAGLGTAASLFFVALATGMLTVRLFSGRLQDRRGPNAVILPLGALFTVALVLLGVATEPWLVITAGLLAGLGYGGASPTLQVVAATRARPERLGIATSTHYLLLDTSIAFGPVVFGALIPLIGYRGHFLVLAATVLAGVVLYWFVHGRGHHGGRP